MLKFFFMVFKESVYHSGIHLIVSGNLLLCVAMFFIKFQSKKTQFFVDLSILPSRSSGSALLS